MTTATRHPACGARPYDGPDLGWPDQPRPEASGRRVVVAVGEAPLALVYGTLTATWRDAGQPLHLAWPDHAPIGDTVRLWLHDHHVCGHIGEPFRWPQPAGIRSKAWRVLAFSDCEIADFATLAGLDMRWIQ